MGRNAKLKKSRKVINETRLSLNQEGQKVVEIRLWQSSDGQLHVDAPSEFSLDCLEALSYLQP